MTHGRLRLRRRLGLDTPRCTRARTRETRIFSVRPTNATHPVDDISCWRRVTSPTVRRTTTTTVTTKTKVVIKSRRRGASSLFVARRQKARRRVVTLLFCRGITPRLRTTWRPLARLGRRVLIFDRDSRRAKSRNRGLSPLPTPRDSVNNINEIIRK